MSPAGGNPHDEPEELPTDRSRDSPKKAPNKEWGGWKKALREIAPYLDLGWRLAGAAAFPPLIGAFVDVQLQMSPWGLLVGAVVGLVGASLQLRRLQQEFHS